jgi:signal peptidase II
MKNRLFWIAAIISLVVDQLTKYWVVQNFNLTETQPLLLGVFHLTYITNTGAAFSLFSGQVEWLRWLSLLVSLGLMALAWFGGVLNTFEQLGYGLILGGALGMVLIDFLLVASLIF